MHTLKVGTRSTCTHAVCTHQPTECCKSAGNALRRAPMGVASIVLKKLKNCIGTPSATSFLLLLLGILFHIGIFACDPIACTVLA